jgi:hypothetical protein
LTHQLADELQLATTCSVGRDGLGLLNGVIEGFWKIELIQLMAIESQQGLSQILKGRHVTFALGLAGRVENFHGFPERGKLLL